MTKIELNFTCSIKQKYKNFRHILGDYVCSCSFLSSVLLIFFAEFCLLWIIGMSNGDILFDGMVSEVDDDYAGFGLFSL